MPAQNRGFVLLFNVNHAMMKLTMDEFGMNAAKILAGLPVKPLRSAGVLWLLRGLLLIPVFQLFDIAGTLVRLRHWRRDPDRRPNQDRILSRHILLPLIPNALIALTLIPMLGKMRGFLRCFAPDFSWIARLSGSFAAIWMVLRTGLLL